MAFKMVEDPYGTLTFMRLYQGRFVKGGTYFNQRTGRKERMGRIVRMHADQREDIDEAQRRHRGRAGHRLRQRRHYDSETKYCTLENKLVTEPVIARRSKEREGADRLERHCNAADARKRPKARARTGGAATRVAARARPGEAHGGDGVQDGRGPVRHADVHAALSGAVRQGRDVLQPADRPEGADGTHRADARRPARGHRRGPGRRHRGRAGHRLRQRRHLRLRAEVLHAGEHVRAGAGHPHGHCAAEPGRGRPAEQGPAPLPPRGPDACT